MSFSWFRIIIRFFEIIFSFWLVILSNLFVIVLFFLREDQASEPRTNLNFRLRGWQASTFGVCTKTYHTIPPPRRKVNPHLPGSKHLRCDSSLASAWVLHSFQRKDGVRHSPVPYFWFCLIFFCVCVFLFLQRYHFLVLFFSLVSIRLMFNSKFNSKFKWSINK